MKTRSINQTWKRIPKYYTLYILILILLTTGCKKFLEIDPLKGSATSDKIFANDQVATSAITGIYSRMVATYTGGTSSATLLGGLSSDEMIGYSAQHIPFYTNSIFSSNGSISTIWIDSFAYIYTANAVLEGLESSTGVSSTTRKQLEGEARFVRAFCYFYLVNLFGEIPLNLTTDYSVNLNAKKSTVPQIYAQIISDLQFAQNLLAPAYPTTDRVRPNKWAATSLLARVYLFNQQWELAISSATSVIDQKTVYIMVDDLDKVFLKGSTEAIWQLMPASGTNTAEGATFILTSSPTYASLTPLLVNAFETGDNRKNKWVNQFTNAAGTYYYPYKYKVKSSATVTEYSMVLRLAEQYLIRAEAYAKSGNATASLDDINLIRKRAGLTVPLTGLNANQCLEEIEKQRKFELFAEWGHRWLDLKRTNRASTVLLPVKGSNWSDTDVLYPLPDNELQRNPNLSQNIGY